MGLLEYSNGDSYDGQWEQDQRHGEPATADHRRSESFLTVNAYARVGQVLLERDGQLLRGLLEGGPKGGSQSAYR